MTKSRIILSLLAVATVSGCSSMSGWGFGDADTTASHRSNYVYGEERTARHEPTPAPAAAAVVTPAPAPAPAPVAQPAPQPTPAPIMNAEPMVNTATQK